MYRKFSLLAILLTCIMFTSINLAYSQEDITKKLQQSMDAQNEAILNARFSPRWLATYSQDLETRGMSKELCIKVIKAAKMINEVMGSELSNQTDATKNEKGLSYVDAMNNVLDDYLKYYETGKMPSTFDKDEERVLTSDIFKK